MFEGTPSQMLASLDRLAALPPDTRVCCGHEYTLANAAFGAAVYPENPALRGGTLEAREMRDRDKPTRPATLAGERAANPFLRVDAPAVRDAVAARLGHPPADRVETFAGLRHWKDGFGA
jgi:hydroxyacylglutathione hydrolase